HCRPQRRCPDRRLSLMARPRECSGCRSTYKPLVSKCAGFFVHVLVLLFIALPLALGDGMPFKPPDRAESLSAIGLTDSMPARLRAALTPGDDFLPLQAPGPSDWLANHPERGQTFDAFVRAHANRPDATRKRLYLLPLGAFARNNSPSLDHLREFA